MTLGMHLANMLGASTARVAAYATSGEVNSDERLFSVAGRGESDFEALFTALTAGQDYFFVSALNELAAQPKLLERLEGYEIAAEGNGYILYDLRRVKEP